VWVALGVIALVAVLAGFFFYRKHAKRVELEQTIAREKSEQAEPKRVAKEEAAREAASRKAEDDRSAAAERAAQEQAARRKSESCTAAGRGRAAQPGVYPAR
jgi:FtsZ-interacting cell division protein ZipA